MSNGHRGGTRMQKQWASLGGVSASMVGNGISIGVPLSQGVPLTVMRMIGEYAATFDTAPVAQDQCTITVGIGVVSTDAATLGTTAMPDPFDEVDFPWLYWNSHVLFAADTSLVSGSEAASFRVAYDIRSMRKLKPRESLIMVAQYTNGAVDPPVQFQSAQSRVLIAT